MFAYLILTVIWRRAEQVLESFGLVFFNLFFREGGREEVGEERKREKHQFIVPLFMHSR